MDTINQCSRAPEITDDLLRTTLDNGLIMKHGIVVREDYKYSPAITDLAKAHAEKDISFEIIGYEGEMLELHPDSFA